MDKLISCGRELRIESYMMNRNPQLFTPRTELVCGIDLPPSLIPLVLGPYLVL